MEDPILVATALLYRAQMYCMVRAERQKSTEQGDAYRQNYNAAAKLIRALRESIDKERTQ